MRARSIITAALLLCTLMASSGAAFGADDDDARKVHDSLYGPKIKAVKATRDTGDDLALASQMLESARKSGDQPKLLAAICESVFALASTDPAGYETAVEAMRLIAATDPFRNAEALDSITDLRRKQFAKAKADERPTVGALFVDAMLDSAQSKSDGGDHAGAVVVLRQALVTARQIKSTNAEAVRLRLDQASHRHRLQERIVTLRAKLLQDATDKATAAELVMLHVADLDDPQSAIKFLEQAGDETLKTRVKLAAGEVADAGEAQALEMGDWYRDLAGKAQGAVKPTLLLRAAAFYERYLALNTSSDVQRKGAELALSEAVKALEASGVARAEVARTLAPQPASITAAATKQLGGAKLPPAAKSGWRELLGTVDIKRHCVTGEWKITRDGLVAARGEKESILFIPVEIVGEYELKVELQATADIGALTTNLPTPKGIARFESTLRAPGAGGYSDGLTEKWGVRMHEDFVRVTKARNETVDPSTDLVFTDLASKIRNVPRGSFISIGTQGAGLTIRSVQIRMLSGDVKAWQGE